MRQRERLKSFILVVLVVLSVLQVGILWNINDRSSPFYFAAKYLNISQAIQDNGLVEQPTSDSGAKRIVLNPYRVTLCDGEDHYVIPRGSDEFKDILDTSFSLYEEILNGRALRRDISLDTWSSLVSRKSILLEFKRPIPLDVLMWAIGFYNTSSSAPEDVLKLLLIPRDGTTVGLYILTSTGGIQFTPGNVSLSDMEKLYSEALTAADINNMNVIKYATISEFGASSFPGFKGDVMGNIYGRKSTLFRDLKYTVPFFVRSAEFENTVLGNDINSYSRSIENSGNTMVYKNYSNLYRLYNDGIMEYSYIPTVTAQDKGDIYSALANALTFVQRIKNDLLDEPELYLSGISQDETSYRFEFDYIFGDFPVYFYHELKQMDEVIAQENAVVIRSNSKRAISCRWALVDMYFGNDIKDLQTAFDTIDVTNFSRKSVDDISIVYHFNLDYKDQFDTAKPVWPEWRIESPDSGAEFIPMREGTERGSQSGMGQR